MTLNTLWCDLFHGGGQIKRDCYGRINWQCVKCLRWSDPVDSQTERLITEAAIETKMKEKKMKTLEEHNAERKKAFTQMQSYGKPHPNGIGCPKCEGELWDSNPMMTLSSHPPQKDVHCPACGYRGYRIA